MSSENALILWARGLATRATADPIIIAARAAADTLRRTVVTTAEDAQAVTELLNAVRNGRGNAKKALDDILRDPKSAIAEAKAQIDPLIKAFEEVETAGKSAVTRFLVAQQETVRASEAKAKAEAETAARLTDLPPMESAPVETQSIVRAASGGSINLRRTLRVELLDARAVAEWDDSLLRLVDAEALSSYKHYGGGTEQMTEAKVHPAGGLEWKGMRFYDEVGSQLRGSR